MIAALLRILAAGAVALLLASCAVTLLGMREHVADADAIVVLGNAVHAGEPSPRLAARLGRAAELYATKRAPIVIVSGAIEPDGGDEAAVMRAVLIARGVPDSAIVADPNGRDTWETARFTSRWLAAHHARSVIAVSQYFHLLRSELALRRFGVPVVYRAGPRYFEWRDGYSAAREVVGLVRYATRRAPAAGG